MGNQSSAPRMHIDCVLSASKAQELDSDDTKQDEASEDEASEDEAFVDKASADGASEDDAFVDKASADGASEDEAFVDKASANEAIANEAIADAYSGFAAETIADDASGHDGDDEYTDNESTGAVSPTELDWEERRATQDEGAHALHDCSEMVMGVALVSIGVAVFAAFCHSDSR